MGTLPSEYSAAIRSVRWAKNLFWLLMALAIVVQLVVFGLVAWSKTVDALYGPAEAVSQPATGQTAQSAVDRAELWRVNFHWLLGASMFLAMLVGFLLAGSLLVSVQVALVGRLGGVASLLSAFFWSLMLLAILVPWQYAFPQLHVPGALFDYNELYSRTLDIKASWGATDVSIAQLIGYHGRFLAYPILAVLIWLLVDLKFRAGCRKMVVTAAEPLP
ncbi:MAG: hypothetical protein MUP47_08170 [Phycisphaerae bacterium]|nr:hypothetical protein [Phycisphaerae bacterium]